MTSRLAAQMQDAVFNALVKSVKEVCRSHDFGKDLWFNYCHEHAPGDGTHASVVKDPARSSNS